MDEANVSSTEIRTYVSKSTFQVVEDERTYLLSRSGHHYGLSWQLAILFIMGEVLGGGVIAIGSAMVGTGWYGLGLIFLTVSITMYIGRIHSEVIYVVSRSHQNLLRMRDPYSGVIGYTLGEKPKQFSTALLAIFSISVDTVYLLISSELIVLVVNDLFPAWNTKYEFRIWLVIFAACLIPLTWLGTPKEFWGVAFGATLSVVVGASLLIYLIWTDYTKNLSDIPTKTITTVSFFSGFGTIFFAFTGIPFFPNIQSDMKNQKDFPKSLYYAFVLIVLIYVPVAVSAFLVYGANTNDNIIYNIFQIHSNGTGSVTHRVICYIIVVMFAGHFIFAYNLILNPLAQEIEEYLKLPRGFCWQRCLLRTGLVLLTLALAEAIPQFNIILSLIGGTIQVILSFQLPSLAYYKLKPNMPWSTKLILCFSFVIACIGMVGTLYATIINLIKLYSTVS